MYIKIYFRDKHALLVNNLIIVYAQLLLLKFRVRIIIIWHMYCQSKSAGNMGVPEFLRTDNRCAIVCADNPDTLYKT